MPKQTGSMDLIKKALAILKQKPVRLWGISLMGQLLMVLAVMVGVLPIISLPITFVLHVGMTAVYLTGYRGGEVNSDALFSGFQRFFKVAGAIGWMELWILIWCMIPIAGPVFAIIKSYAYRFVPYIIIEDPKISATEALRLSMKKTEGFKARMFWADFLPGLFCTLASVIRALLSRIPYAGILFTIILAILSIVVAVALPLLLGLIGAAGYEEFFVKEGKGDQA